MVKKRKEEGVIRIQVSVEQSVSGTFFDPEFSEIEKYVAEGYLDLYGTNAAVDVAELFHSNWKWKGTDCCLSAAPDDELTDSCNAAAVDVGADASDFAFVAGNIAAAVVDVGNIGAAVDSYNLVLVLLRSMN